MNVDEVSEQNASRCNGDSYFTDDSSIDKDKENCVHVTSRSRCNKQSTHTLTDDEYFPPSSKNKNKNRRKNKRKSKSKKKNINKNKKSNSKNKNKCTSEDSNCVDEYRYDNESELESDIDVEPNVSVSVSVALSSDISVTDLSDCDISNISSEYMSDANNNNNSNGKYRSKSRRSRSRRSSSRRSSSRRSSPRSNRRSRRSARSRRNERRNRRRHDHDGDDGDGDDGDDRHRTFRHSNGSKHSRKRKSRENRNSRKCSRQKYRHEKENEKDRRKVRSPSNRNEREKKRMTTSEDESEKEKEKNKGKEKEKEKEKEKDRNVNMDRNMGNTDPFCKGNMAGKNVRANHRAFTFASNDSDDNVNDNSNGYNRNETHITVTYAAEDGEQIHSIRLPSQECRFVNLHKLYKNYDNRFDLFYRRRKFNNNTNNNNSNNNNNTSENSSNVKSNKTIVENVTSKSSSSYIYSNPQLYFENAMSNNRLTGQNKTRKKNKDNKRHKKKSQSKNKSNKCTSITNTTNSNNNKNSTNNGDSAENTSGSCKTRRKRKTGHSNDASKASKASKTSDVCNTMNKSNENTNANRFVSGCMNDLSENNDIDEKEKSKEQEQEKEKEKEKVHDINYTVRNRYRLGHCLFYCVDEEKIFWARVMCNANRATCQHFCGHTGAMATRSIGLKCKTCVLPHDGPCIYVVPNQYPPPKHDLVLENKHILKMFTYRYHYQNERVVLPISKITNQLRSSLKKQHSYANSILLQNVKFIPGIYIRQNYKNKRKIYDQNSKFVVKQKHLKTNFNKSVEIYFEKHLKSIESLYPDDNDDDDDDTSDSDSSSTSAAGEDDGINANNTNNTTTNDNINSGNSARVVGDAMIDEAMKPPDRKRRKISKNKSVGSDNINIDKNSNSKTGNELNTVNKLSASKIESIANSSNDCIRKLKEKDFQSVIAIVNPILSQLTQLLTMKKKNVRLGLDIYLYFGMSKYYLNQINQALDILNKVIDHKYSTTQHKFNVKYFDENLYWICNICCFFFFI